MQLSAGRPAASNTQATAAQCWQTSRKPLQLYAGRPATINTHATAACVKRCNAVYFRSQYTGIASVALVSLYDSVSQFKLCILAIKCPRHDMAFHSNGEDKHASQCLQLTC